MLGCHFDYKIICRLILQGASSYSALGACLGWTMIQKDCLDPCLQQSRVFSIVESVHNAQADLLDSQVDVGASTHRQRGEPIFTDHQKGSPCGRLLWPLPPILGRFSLPCMCVGPNVSSGLLVWHLLGLLWHTVNTLIVLLWACQNVAIPQVPFQLSTPYIAFAYEDIYVCIGCI